MILFDPSRDVRWLFLFAHPDDELAVAGWLSFLHAQSVPFEVVYATGTAQRLAEAKQALDKLKISNGPPQCLDFKDGSLVENLDSLALELRKLCERVQPDRVVVCAFEQGHLDHDALHAACRAAWSGPLIEYPEYWPYSPWILGINRFSTGSRGDQFYLTPDLLALKNQAILAHASQRIGAIKRLQEVLRWIRRSSARVGGIEIMRWVDRETDLRVPQHTAWVQMIIRRHPKWVRWMKAIDRFEP